MFLGSSEDELVRGRDGKTKVTRRPSPGLAARLRRLQEEMAARSNGNSISTSGVDANFIVTNTQETREMFEERQKLLRELAANQHIPSKHTNSSSSLLLNLKSSLKKPTGTGADGKKKRDPSPLALSQSVHIQGSKDDSKDGETGNRISDSDSNSGSSDGGSSIVINSAESSTPPATVIITTTYSEPSEATTSSFLEAEEAEVAEESEVVQEEEEAVEAPLEETQEVEATAAASGFPGSENNNNIHNININDDDNNNNINNTTTATATTEEYSNSEEYAQSVDSQVQPLHEMAPSAMVHRRTPSVHFSKELSTKELPPLPVENFEEEDEEYEYYDGDGMGTTRQQIIERIPDTPPSSAESTPLPKLDANNNYSHHHHQRTRTSSSARPMTASSTFTMESHRPSTPPDTDDTNPYGTHTLQRRGSMVSLSRVPFSAQLGRLTSLSLPLSEDLSESIKSIESSERACQVISASAKHIHKWIDTAKTVLKGLDAEDDVEWAAQGRESLSEVDAAVQKFSALVNVYITVIDDLHRRSDIHSVGSDVLEEIVSTMEETLASWEEVSGLLKDIKNQVETAMEWTELWSSVLHDIQAELEACHTLVFELEERRHLNAVEEQMRVTGTNGNVDLDSLTTIVEETPATANAPDDSALLGLFARMQPLRASLDFLPMRLQSFQARAENIFPGACQDLENRRLSLESKWKKLEHDAGVLRRELGEDKWVVIFRNAGRQAGNMIESVERSVMKLRDALDSEHVGESSLIKRVESYEAKKIHYGPAIQRVLSIIERGVHDRLTVNGEILRLQSSMSERWRNVEAEMDDLSSRLEHINLSGTTQQHLRDSLSSIISTEPSHTGLLSPQTSPASSVIGSTTSTNPPSTRESSVGPSKIAAPTPMRPGLSNRYSASPSLSRQSSPAASRLAVPRRSTASKTPDNRPRWSAVTNQSDVDLGHNFKPLSASSPATHRRQPVTPTPPPSRIPCPSPSPLSPTLASSRRLPPSSSRRPTSTLLFPRSPSSASSPGFTIPPPKPRPELRHQQSMANMRRSVSPNPVAHYPSARPASAMAARPPSTTPMSSKRSSYMHVESRYSQKNLASTPTTAASKRNSMPPGRSPVPGQRPSSRLDRSEGSENMPVRPRFRV